MIPRLLLITLYVITFLKLTTSTGYSSWEPATTSFDSKTNDQTKKRLKSGMPERISQFGGDSMPHSSLDSHENVGYISDVRNGHENKRVHPNYHSHDYEYQYREEPMKHMTGSHHANKNQKFKKSLHGSFARKMQMPSLIHSDRLRRKLDEGKDNMTQNSNLTLHNDTEVGIHQKPNEEHKNGTKKPCIRTHPYTIISSPTLNVTHNNSTTTNTTGLTVKPDQKIATNHSVHNANGTILPKNETNENSTTSIIGKEKLSKDANLADIDSTPKGNDTGKSVKQKGQGFGLQCNVMGEWVSEAGGVTLNIKTSQDKSHLDVEILELSPAKKGFLSKSWKLTGNLPFADDVTNKINGTASAPTTLGGPIILTATIAKDPSDNTEGKVAVFLGECRVCYEGMESIVGMWSLKRLSKDCMDASLSQKEIKDVLHRDATPTAAKEQSKSESSDGTKPKDSTDQSRGKHSYRRRSFNKEGKHRRYIRNNQRYA